MALLLNETQDLADKHRILRTTRSHLTGLEPMEVGIDKMSASKSQSIRGSVVRVLANKYPVRSQVDELTKDSSFESPKTISCGLQSGPNWPNQDTRSDFLY